MMMKYVILFAFGCLLAESVPLLSDSLARIARAQNGFEDGVSKGRVSAVNEASGLGASRRHPGVLYTLNDSGGRARLYAISANSGSLKGVLTISGSRNQDWEDLAVGPCGDGGTCIFIADVGGNSGAVSNTVYKVREPSYIGDQTLNVVSSFKFTWSQKDCESVMVDERGQVYLISKVSNPQKPKLFALPNSGWGSSSRVNISSVATIPISYIISNPVAADISPNGNEILVRTYGKIYYWKRGGDESISDALSRVGIELPIKLEKQGESICWSASGDGYYTLSEGVNRDLYFFRRQ